MPAVTTLLMDAGTAFHAVQALNQKSEAEAAASQAALNATKIGDKTVNALASLKVPTLGTELAQQNAQARQLTDLQALKEGGAATVLGGMTAREGQARAEDLQLQAQTDERAYNRDLAVAQQEQANADAKLNRQYQLEMSRLAGAQTAAANAQSTLNQSIGSAAQIAGDIATMNAYTGKTPKKIFGNKKDGIDNAVTAVGRDLGNTDPFAATINVVPGGLTSRG